MPLAPNGVALLAINSCEDRANRADAAVGLLYCLDNLESRYAKVPAR
jgi:hypothetical protein